jgi:hypothetical protein
MCQEARLGSIHPDRYVAMRPAGGSDRTGASNVDSILAAPFAISTGADPSGDELERSSLLRALTAPLVGAIGIANGGPLLVLAEAPRHRVYPLTHRPVTSHLPRPLPLPCAREATRILCPWRSSPCDSRSSPKQIRHALDLRPVFTASGGSARWCVDRYAAANRRTIPWTVRRLLLLDLWGCLNCARPPDAERSLMI